jgi:octaprenyl-diphosphate synthase
MQNFSEIQALMKSDMEKTDEILIDRLNSNVDLINQMSHYIIASGGKRLRPLLLLLSARATNYTGTDHHASLPIIETIKSSGTKP